MTSPSTPPTSSPPKTPLIVSVRKPLTVLWRWLTKVSPNLKTDEQRQRASLIVLVSLALLIANLCLGPMWVINYRALPMLNWLISGLMLVLLAAYLVSRTIHYQLGAVFVLFALFAAALYSVLIPHTPIQDRLMALNLLFVAIQVTSFLFGLRGTIVTGLACIIGTSLLIFAPEIRLQWVFTYVGYMIIVSALMLAVNYASTRNANRFQESEMRYRALFEQSNDAVVLLNLHGEYILVNHRAADMLGYTVAEFQGLKISDISPQPEESAGVIQRLLAGEKMPLIDRKFYKKNGDIITLEVNVELVRDAYGNPLHIQSVGRDVTERQKTEQLNAAFLADLQALQAIHLELSEIESLDTLYYRMVELAQKRLHLDRLALFLIDEHKNELCGTYGIDVQGVIRNEQYYREPITPNHWSTQISDSPNHTTFLNDVPLVDNKVEVGRGWHGATALWTGHQAIGYISADNLIRHEPARPYQAEMISLLGSTYGHLIQIKQAAARLRESEERHRSVFSVLSEAVLVQNRDTEYIAANKAAETIFGAPIERITGASERRSPAWPVIHEDGTPFTADEFPTVRTFKTGKPTNNVIMGLARPDGKLLWMSVNVQPMFVEGETLPNTVVISMTDITQRQEAQAALQASEARHRALLNAIPDVILRLDRDGRYLDYHAVDKNDLLVSPDELLAKRMVDLLPPSIAHLHLSKIAFVLDTGNSTVYEFSLKVRNEQRHLEARIARASSDEVIMIIRNQTERKKAEAQSFALAVERERMKVLSQFVQNASHELRTPLSVINTSVYLMTRLTDEDSRITHAEIASRTINRLTRLLDMIMSLTKLDSNISMEITKRDINRLITDLVTTTREPANDKQIAIELNLDHSLDSIRVDADWITDAISHLIENAVIFSRSGSTITITTSAVADNLIIAVKDRGIGISTEDIPNIFKRFWRLDEAHSTPGFGLGLPIAQRIVELHSGRIEVESVVGKGSTFRIVLPR
jgi:PAS domain S-box-containing protein